MDSFPVRILAADRPFYEGSCLSLTIPIQDGEMGILAHHSSMVVAVVPGELRLKTAEGEDQVAAVSSGLVKIEDGEVLALVDSAERPEEIDANRAQRAADEAREALLQRRSAQEYRMAQANLARALNRLRVKSENSFPR